MNYLDKIRACKRSELPELARAITDDKASFPRVIVDLARGGTLDDHMRLAEVLTYAAIDGTRDDEVYSTRRESAGQRYVDMFLSCCKSCGYPEREYVGVLIGALNAPPSCALYDWRAIAEEYLIKRAKSDFDLVAEYIDRYDKTYSAYTILLSVNRAAAIGILINKVLYEKYIDKSAVRTILMTCPDITDALIAAYDGMNAKDRAAIVRLLVPHRADPAVEAFLSKKAAHDTSATVLKELSRTFDCKASRSTNAVRYFENLMSTGETVKYGKLCCLLGMDKAGRAAGPAEKSKSAKYGEVAENIFFVIPAEDDFGAAKVICYDGKKFFDLNGRKVKPSDDTEIGVLHPLDLDETDPLFSLDIDQPFPQLHRATYRPLPGEKLFSKRLFGTFVSAAEFSARQKKLCFDLCDGDGNPVALRIVGKYAVGAEYDGKTYMCDRVYYYRTADIVRQGRRLFLPKAPLDIAELDGKAYSELTYYAARLFDGV